MTTAGRLTGRVALVTGGGRGLGAAICEALADHGAAVGVNDLDGGRAATVAASIGAAGGRAIALPADVADGTAVDAMVTRLGEEWGRVDILVNNAGIPPTGVGAGPFVSSSPDDWRALIELNLIAVLHCVHAVLPGMIEQHHGRIVTIVSDAGRVGQAGIAVYGAAKAAAASFSRSLAQEVGRDGITSNCVSLGSLLTERRTPESVAREAKRYPVGRLGAPADVVPVVLLLASDEAGWITAQTYGVDGGYAPS